ncbi:MAG: 50S ribosome-binding GTPase [Planctomycetaceae bacterium]|nr:50S ribosome-binding GTPase [Planctomycetaceae bacterium]
MAANLTPQYYRAEEQYRRAQTVAERVACLEELLRVIPKHKGTDRLQGDLRFRLKEAKEQLRRENMKGAASRSMPIPRQGAARVVVMGAPNSGKSQLVSACTGASLSVAPYPFSTRHPTAALMDWNHFRIQFIDTPPVSLSHWEPSLTDLVRSADLVLLCADGSQDDGAQAAFDVIEQFAERKIQLSHRSGFDEQRFAVVHVKSVLVVTRSWNSDWPVRKELFSEWNAFPFSSAEVESGDEESVLQLKAKVVKELGLIRVFTKKPGEPAELIDPYILKSGATVAEISEKVHADLANRVKTAKIRRGHEKTPLNVGLDFELCDLDIVELH